MRALILRPSYRDDPPAVIIWSGWVEPLRFTDRIIVRLYRVKTAPRKQFALQVNSLYQTRYPGFSASLAPTATAGLRAKLSR